MKSSEIIRKAKKHLSKTNDALAYTNQSPYICDALGSVICRTFGLSYSEHAALKNKVNDIRSLITERIEYKFSLESWLISKGVPRQDITPVLMQKHRLQWMDMLISEFESKGD